MNDATSPRPPRIGRGLLSLLLGSGEHWGLVGDFDEMYAERARDKGRLAAWAWYWGQIVKFAPSYLYNSLIWSKDMFKNHMLIAWRNIKKSEAYSALNILGLAAGMAVFILIMLFIRTELSYDRYHANAQNIYRVIEELPEANYKGSNLFAVTAGPVAPALMAEFPEVRAAARLKSTPNNLLEVGEKTFFEKKIFWADPQVFEIFSFPFVLGDRATALRDPFSILVSEREARRLFGEDSPLGRTVRYRGQADSFDFKVAGVFRDIPANSHFAMEIVAPFETTSKALGEDLTSWDHESFWTYLLLREGADPKAVEAKFPAFLGRHGKAGELRLVLQPLTRVHLSPGIMADLTQAADPRFVYLLASIAVLILFIACVNYMNLAAARSLKRTKEVGLRKVIGAARGQLVRQFLGDSVLLTFLALLLAVGAVLLVLPAFRAFVERQIAFNPLREMVLIPGLLGLALVVGLIAGSYPALFVSAFRPVSTLKGTGASKARGAGLRNGLIVFQFAASIALIICTVGVRSQLRYIRSTDVGYNRDQIVVLTPRGGVRKDAAAFKAELKKDPAILGVSISTSLPNSVDSRTSAEWPGRPEKADIPMYFMTADYDFLPLYGLKLAQGRNFSREFPADAQGAYLLNEAGQKALGWPDAVGRAFGEAERPGRIVGVVKDFHLHSLHLPISPLFIAFSEEYVRYVSVKIQGGDIPGTLDFIKKTWRRFEPDYPFEYQFFDDMFDKAYREEQRTGTMFGLFAGLAVLIASLGLVGLASFAAERKTKEIGIRKVLGASSGGVIVLLSREFMKWVVLANIIAWPVGYFVMRGWLKNFAYRTSLTMPMFLGSALAAFAIAAAVISLQTYRAATANPSDSIRYE